MFESALRHTSSGGGNDYGKAIRDLPVDITIFADLCSGTLGYKINDVCYGVAFENIDIDEDLYFAYWVGKPGFTCTIKNSAVFYRE